MEVSGGNHVIFSRNLVILTQYLKCISTKSKCISRGRAYTAGDTTYRVALCCFAHYDSTRILYSETLYLLTNWRPPPDAPTEGHRSSHIGNPHSSSSSSKSMYTHAESARLARNSACCACSHGNRPLAWATRMSTASFPRSACISSPFDRPARL